MSMNNLTVALLLEDLELAKEFSDIFRELGVVAHFYEDLDSFWKGTLEVIPTLSLVDVKKMHEGTLLLKNHPFVKNDQLPMAFFFSSNTAPLLHSTYEFFNMGTILKGANYRGQVKSILKRLNKMLSYEQRISKIEIEKNKLSNQVRGLIEVSQVYKEDHFYDRYLKDLCNNFETEKIRCMDFFESCENVFSELEDISEFAYLELSSNGQRLLSPESTSMKFVTIPSLFLGRTCHNGIEEFAQNMGSQVAVDLLGGEVMSLNIKGKRNNPDLIIYLKLNDITLSEKLDWTALENYLNGVYASFNEGGKLSLNREARFITAWEAFSLFDKQVKSAVNGDIKNQFALIDINLSDIIVMAREGKSGEFYWKSFYQDFIARVLNAYPKDLKFISMGVNNLGVLCEYAHLDQAMTHLKNIAHRFSYWRYFENADTLLAKSLRPEVKMIPASAEAYLLHVEEIKFSALDELDKLDLKSKAKELVWGRAPERTL
ncbi:hypothetical protein [Halobacteriovorax sp. HLS]|uniref:hypothetical protein n=1 Tax=Halobacteriovorax sp. HLS TaxID=2234000 RepID=UPI000FDAF220|nr:hypothetical protein [Halobacteriovorax sp. HLS]